MKHILALGVIFTASVANALYLADSDQGVNCDCPAHLKGQLKIYGGKWSLYRDYGDESHPGSSCKDIKDRKGEDSANGIYWIKLKGRTQILSWELSSEPSTVNPLLSPPGAYLFQTHLRGGGVNRGFTVV